MAVTGFRLSERNQTLKSAYLHVEVKFIGSSTSKNQANRKENHGFPSWMEHKGISSGDGNIPHLD